MIKKNFFHGLLSGGMGFVIKTFAMLILTPQMISLLGVQQYGAYLILMSFSELSLLAASGMTTSFIQKYSLALGGNQKEDCEALLISARWVYWFIALGVILIGWPLLPILLSYSFKHQVGVPYNIVLCAAQLVLVSAAFNILGQYISGVLWAHCLHKQTNIIDTVRGVMEAAVAVMILYAKGGLIEIFIARLIIAIISALVFWQFAWKAETALHNTWYKLQCSRKSMQDLLALSFFATFEKISIFVAHRLDEVIIAIYLTLTDVSCFGLVMRILSQVASLMIRLLAGVNPIFAHLKAQNNTEASQFLFLRSIALMHYAAIILLLLIMGGFPEFYNYMGDGKLSYHQALPIALIAAVLVWTGSIQIPASSYLFSNGLYRFSTFSTFITAMCNLGLSVFLIQRIGLPGVILGTLIPHGIQNHAVTIPYSLRLLKIKYSTYINQVFIKTLPAIVVPTGLVIAMRYLGLHWYKKELLPFSFIIPSLITIGCISAVIWVMCCLDKKEKDLLLSLATKMPGFSKLFPQLETPHS